MTKDIETAVETTAMLSGSNKPPRIVSSTEFDRLPRNPRKESLRDFIKDLGSVGSLPGHQGKPFSTTRGIVNQCIAAFAVFVLSAAAGQPIGFSAVLLPQLYAENSTMHADLEMGSWIASVHSAATPVGSLLAGATMERLGRLRTLQLSVLPLVAGWVVLATAQQMSVLLVGRVLCGYSVGTLAATGQVYLGEISDPKLRGMLSGAPFVNYSLGILFIYALGQLPWRWVAASGVLLPLLATILLLRAPETPDWLARHGKLTQAHAAVLWLRGDEALAKKEIHQILTASAKERDEQARTRDTFLTTIKRSPVLKPLIIINVFNMLQIFSGTYIVIFYAVDIIRDVAGDEIDSLIAAILTAVIRLVFCIIGCFLLYYVDRRTMCIVSGIGSTVTSLALGIFMFCRIDHEPSSLDIWVTATCIIVYIASNTLGFMMLPGLMVGELLPAKIRGMCGGYIFMVFNLTLFGFTKLYPLMKTAIGSHGLFIIFGVASLLGTIFMYLVLPETRNKSLLQIEQYFEKSNFLWRNRKLMVTDCTNI